MRASSICCIPLVLLAAAPLEQKRAQPRNAQARISHRHIGVRRPSDKPVDQRRRLIFEPVEIIECHPMLVHQ